MKAARMSTIMVSLVVLLTAFLQPAEAGAVSVSYLYKLSNFQGVIPYASPKLVADRNRNEVYAITGWQVSVFNRFGMEIFSTDFDPEYGMLYDIAIDDKGDIYALLNKNGKSTVWLCNYRLEPQRALELRSLPSQYDGFVPNMLRCLGDRFYLANSATMKIIVTDRTGAFVSGYNVVDIFKAMQREGAQTTEREKEREKRQEESFVENGLDGFNVDNQGNIIFVLPVSGKACRLSPDGTLEQFGKRGSGVGKFGVPSCIVADRNGNYLVSDKLRSVIIIFDKNLKVIQEFNNAGKRDSWMSAPMGMEMGGDGKLYVGQLLRRGVIVYQINDGDS